MSIKKLNILFNIRNKKLDYKTYVGTTTIKKKTRLKVCVMKITFFIKKKIELRLKSVKLKKNGPNKKKAVNTSSVSIL